MPNKNPFTPRAGHPETIWNGTFLFGIPIEATSIPRFAKMQRRLGPRDFLVGRKYQEGIGFGFWVHFKI